MHRFNRVLFDIISSPFLISATIKHHLKETSKESNFSEDQDHQHQTININKDMYVENLITGTGHEEEAFQLHKETKESFRKI